METSPFQTYSFTRGAAVIAMGAWVYTRMAYISSSGFAHVRLTVTDIVRSKKFYDALFGWPIAVDASASVNEPGVTESPDKFYGGVVYETPQGTLFGLRPVGEARFDSARTGLDHISFAVSSRSELETARKLMTDAELRTAISKILKMPGCRFCRFRIPTTSTSN